LIDLQRWTLEQFCRRHEIDVAEIDSTLTYSENIKHLWDVVGRPLDSVNPGTETSAKADLMSRVVWEGHATIYWQLLKDLTEIIKGRRANDVQTRHQIGVRINYARAQIFEGGEFSDEHGWSGALGVMMETLAKKLDVGVSTLYQSADFAQRFPDWDGFASAKFEVPGKKRFKTGGHDIIIKSGNDLKWTTVLRHVLYPGKRPPEAPPVNPVCWYDESGLWDWVDSGCEGEVKTRTIKMCEEHWEEFNIWKELREMKGPPYAPPPDWFKHSETRQTKIEG